MKQFQPTLNVERLDIVGYLVAEMANEVVANDMLGVADGLLRFWTDCVFPKIGHQVMLRQRRKLEAGRYLFLIDPNNQDKPVHLSPGVPLTGKIPQEAHGQGGYGQDSYAPPGFEPPGGQAYGDDDFVSRGRPPRSGLSGPGRRGPQQGSPHRLGNTRMVLYLAASVIGVVLIVLLVLHLTKSGGNSPPAAGSSTPTARTTATAGASSSSFALTQAADIGTYPLNTAATKEYGTIAVNKAAP